MESETWRDRLGMRGHGRISGRDRFYGHALWGLLTTTPRTPTLQGTMAKSKNHTAHNQNAKAHRNGIKRAVRHKYPALKGVCVDDLVLGMVT